MILRMVLALVAIAAVALVAAPLVIPAIPDIRPRGVEAPADGLVHGLLTLHGLIREGMPVEQGALDEGLGRLVGGGAVSARTSDELSAALRRGALPRPTLVRVLGDVLLGVERQELQDERRLVRRVQAAAPGLVVPPPDATSDVDARDVGTVLRVIALAAGDADFAELRWGYGRIVGPIHAGQTVR